MARIRTIKPEIAKHEELYDLEKETGLPMRFAWCMLFTVCDREGRFKWMPRTLKADILPHDEVEFSRVLDAWLTRGFVVRYRVNGALYGWVPTWRKHQVINNRESESELPGINESDSVEDYRNQKRANASCTRDPRDSDACSTEIQSGKAEGKGREGKGKEGKGFKNDLSDSTENGCDKPRPPDRDSPEALTLDVQQPPGPDPKAERRAAAERVFTHWKLVHEHERSQLDDKRRQLIFKRFDDGYSEADLCNSISGYLNSPHHMGENDRGTKYDSLELMLRGPKYVDQGLKFYAEPPRTERSQLMRRNIAATGGWVPPEMRHEAK